MSAWEDQHAACLTGCTARRGRVAKAGMRGWLKLALVPACILLAWLGECSKSDAAATFGLVTGQVLDGRGHPVAGARLRLYDADTAGPDDLMADGQTDTNGSYRLRYRAGAWDCCQGLREANPDIYVEVLRRSPQKHSQWVLSGRSRVVVDRRTSPELRFDFRLPE